MKIIIKCISVTLFFLSAGLMSCTQTSGDADSVTLIDEGKTNVSIVLPKDAGEVLEFAAAELQEYLQKISGVKVQSGNEKITGLIPIELHVETSDAITTDAFTLDVNNQSITLSGQNDRSVLYAVYAFLEQLGCSWVYPGESEEIVPELSTVWLAIGQSSEKASIEHRGLGLYELHKGTQELGLDLIDWMGKNRLNLLMTSEDRRDKVFTQCMYWPEVKDKLYPEVKKRGMILELSEHMTHVYFPPSLGREHPEWFALIDGERKGTGQMCFSNAEGVDYFGDRVAEYVQNNPEADIVGTWPLDGGGYCECDGCQDPLAAYKAIAKVAEKAAKVNPQTTIEFLAYVDQTFTAPVGLEIPSNLSVLMCDRLDENARKWSELMNEKGGRGQYYFEYLLGDNYRWRCNVWLTPEYGPWLEDTVSSLGFRGVVSLFLPIRNWWRSAFNNHFMAKAYWNPTINIDEELDHYCRTYYGEAGDEIREVLQSIQKDVQNEYLLHNYHSDANFPMKCEDIGDDAFSKSMAVCDQLIIRLGKLRQNSDDAIVAERIRRLKSYMEYFKLYYQNRTEDGIPRPMKDNTVVPEELMEYAAGHPIDRDGVNMNPEFIKWRFKRFHW
jgi:hypothetical protein